MKRNLFVLYSLFLFGNSTVLLQNNFSLAGKIKGVSVGIIYLSCASVIDSSVITSNASFSFKGKVSKPTSAFLVIKQGKSDDNNRTTFFIEPPVMIASVTYNDFKEARLSGSKTQKNCSKTNKPAQQAVNNIDPDSV